jgi:hypothetical protein
MLHNIDNTSNERLAFGYELVFKETPNQTKGTI